MITHPTFTVEPWAVTEDTLHLDVLAQSESVFALSNGHIGLRGNLDEGEPFGLPGTYLNGFYETRPLPYAEAGYGYPEDGQTVVNATNGKLIRLLVDDEPFDIRYGELLAHTRTLDLRAGELRREVRWRSPSGREIEVKTHPRSSPSSQRCVAAIRYEVAPDRRPAAARRRASPSWSPTSRAPRRARTRAPPPRCARRWSPRSRRSTTCASCSCTARAQSGLRMAAGMDHVVEDVDGIVAGAEAAPDLGRVWMTAELAPDKPLVFTKFLAYGWSSRRSLPSVRDQVAAAVASRQAHGLGRAGARPARVHRRLLGRAPTSRSTATASSSRPCASRSSTRCRPARGPSAARSRPRA